MAKSKSVKSGPTTERSDWPLALAGGAMLWVSFPPLGLWPMAWVALIPWLMLIRRKTLVFRSPYRALLITGYVTWLALIHWVRLPHWSAAIGWLILCAYLAIYIPLFIGLSRVAVHSMRVPLWVAAPVVWCGIEAFRSWAGTGFPLMLLSYTQVDVPLLIQISDTGGPHAVSFVIVLFSSLLLESQLLDVILPDPRRSKSDADRSIRWRPLMFAVLVVAATAGYGLVCSSYYNNPETWQRGPADIALIQGSVDTTFSEADDPEKTFAEYLELSRSAIRDSNAADSESRVPPVLIVWPESMFSGAWPNYTSDDGFTKPLDSPVEDAVFQKYVRTTERVFAKKTVAVASELGGVPMLVGTSSVHWGVGEMQVANSALWIDGKGNVVGRYDKMHPVMFGEYVPFADWIPLLNRLSPMGAGLTPGLAPIVVKAGNLNLSPSICFENMVPHVIRRQIRELEDGGTRIDGLITITNDGWFWGSSLLDVHLACGVFRAVENRRPALIAANTGFSAAVDRYGTVREKGPRRAAAVVRASIARGPEDQPDSIYCRFGDWLGQSCSVFCLVAALIGWRGRRRDKPAE